VYLLVDPLAGALDALPEHLHRHPVSHPPLGIAETEAPFLVEFKHAEDPHLSESLAWAVDEHLRACANGSGAYCIGGWLQPYATVTVAGLVNRIGALLQASGAPNAGRYLRLADRRVLHLLDRLGSLPHPFTAPPIDWATQLQGIVQWVYLDHNLALQSLRGKPGTADAQPLQLDRAHWHWMLQAEAINRALTAWQATHHPLPEDALARLLPPLVRAQQAGLREPGDQAAYAAEAVRYPAFESWPPLLGRLERALQTKQLLAERLQALRDEWANTPSTPPTRSPELRRP